MLKKFFTCRHPKVIHDNHVDILFNGYLYFYNEGILNKIKFKILVKLFHMSSINKNLIVTLSAIGIIKINKNMNPLNVVKLMEKRNVMANVVRNYVVWHVMGGPVKRNKKNKLITLLTHTYMDPLVVIPSYIT